MARRDQEQGSYLSAQRGFLNSPSGRQPPAPKSWFSTFVQEEILHSEKRPGNVAVGWGIVFFGASVIFARTLAKDLLVPVF